MTWINVQTSMPRQLVRSAVSLGYRSLDNFRCKVNEALTQVLSSSEVELDHIKKEVWEDLASIYYKYDDCSQKRAFREVMYDIFQKMKEENWDTVYKKLYSLDKKSLS
jgi:hypothetical protein